MNNRKRVAINGLGRIGRIVLRELVKCNNVDVVVVNDLCDVDEIEYLLKYDSVHKNFDTKINIDGDNLIINDTYVKYLCEPKVENLPWKDLEIDLVVECTGLYTKLEDARKHIASGAKHVIISAPGKGDMKTIVYGVNEEKLIGSEEVISAASCTTNCLAPVLKLVDDNFNIQGGFMSTIHAYTNDQVNLDVHHKKGYKSRRGRACAINCIPTATGAADAIGKVIPNLAGKIKGVAYRVPLSDGSMIDTYLQLKKKVTVKEIEELFKNNQTETLKYTVDPIVSQDIIGMPVGALVDGSLIDVIDFDKKQLVKITAWYDNEYGYSIQMVRTICYFLNLT